MIHKGYRPLFIDKTSLRNGVSLGIHWDWKRWRFDFYFMNFALCVGRVPIWEHPDWGDIAVSGSWHERNKDEVVEFYIFPRNNLDK